jgi:Cdc6-like AAA superfamily ATPase
MELQQNPSESAKKLVKRPKPLNTLNKTIPNTNTHIYGKHGNGKTTLTHYTLQKSDKRGIRLNCQKIDTQNKALTTLHKILTDNSTETPQSTSKLKTEIKENIDHPTILTLDNFDFLHHNQPAETDELLYWLSRTPKINVTTISAKHGQLQPLLSERTASSLNTQNIPLPAPGQKQTFKILCHKAKQALGDEKYTKKAIGCIAMQTQNLTFATLWLKEAANYAEDVITAKAVRNVKKAAVQTYHDYRLQHFSGQHELLYEAIQQQLPRPSESITTGEIYTEYKRLCDQVNEEIYSQRRIGDYLDELELLGILRIRKHQGGENGKTREIELQEI